MEGATILQNDPSLSCSPHAEHGRGFGISFDWSDVSHPAGVAYYEIRVQRLSAPLALVHATVGGSAYDFLGCNNFVADHNLEDWQWWVRAVSVDGEVGPWTPFGRFRFEPCRLDDGSACNAPG